MVRIGVLFEDLDLVGMTKKLAPFFSSKGHSVSVDWISQDAYLDFGAGGVSHSLRRIEEQFLTDQVAVVDDLKAESLDYTVDRDRLEKEYGYGENDFLFASRAESFRISLKGTIDDEGWRLGENSNAPNKPDSNIEYFVNVNHGYRLYGWAFYKSGKLPPERFSYFYKHVKRFREFFTNGIINFPKVSKVQYEHGMYAQIDLEVLPPIGSKIAFPCDVYVSGISEPRKTKGSLYLTVPFDNPVFIAGGVSIQASSIDIYDPYGDRDDFDYKPEQLPFMSSPLVEIETDFPDQVNQIIKAETRADED